MRLEDAAAFTEKCFNGEPAACSYACPFKVDVRSQMEKAGKGRWNAAYKSLRSAVLFPVIVSALCPTPCERDCQREQTGDEPIAVRSLEDACIRLAKNTKPDRYVIPPKNEKIAVVGAGLAGLSAALCLAQKNYPVTVFEKDETWGGNLRSHPRFIEFDADIALQFSATEAQFRFDSEIQTLDELGAYDLIYIATGGGGNDFGLLSGWEPKLLTTGQPKAFMGGELTGTELMGGIVQAKELSKTAEVFLQTGKAVETFEDEKGVLCKVDYSGAAPSPRVEPSDPGGYTEVEAKAEASRCLLCDCDRCMVSCEMLNSFRKKPKKIAIEVYTDTKATPPYSTHTIAREAYSCNMCGHCKAICPNDVDMGALLHTSRVARNSEADYPEAFHSYWLREMDYSVGPASFFSPPGDSSEYIFFPGCQLGAHNPEYVLRAHEFMKSQYGAGIYVSCCGAPAYWAGDMKKHGENIEQIRAIWRNNGSPQFVFACATCESVFEEFLPEVRRVSLYELLARSSEIKPAHYYSAASVFDPCNARKNPAAESAVREIAQKSGTLLHELPEKNRCCGYGGHMRLANPPLYDKMTENRASMSDNPYITYCVNCREVFSARGKKCAHVLDIAFGLPLRDSVPYIDEKRENAMKVKMKLTNDLIGSEFVPEKNEWDALELAIDNTVAKNIDRKLIAISDIREAIWLAEKYDDKFIDEEDGVCHCSMEKPPLTYWVQYKKTGEGVFEVYDAYYHRMRIGAAQEG